MYFVLLSIRILNGREKRQKLELRKKKSSKGQEIIQLNVCPQEIPNEKAKNNE